ncbi:hypothetical protein [Dactylosporangium sp. CS-033363]|uniref:hypothetical protein n=1 Tax=Dactylosporangium sp. CS-033363 TaxID=3239935 RepID=UPI003D8A2F0D
MPYRHRLWIAAVLGIAAIVVVALGPGTAPVSAGAAAASRTVGGVALVNDATHRPVLGLSPLTGGTVVDLSRLSGRDLGLQAASTGAATFTLTGASGASFTATGPQGYVDCPLLATPDEYTLTVVTERGEHSTVRFTVTDSAALPAPLDVLFVGNSLLGTFTKASGENTPQLVRHLATTRGRTLNVTQVIHSGYTLQHSWDDGLAGPALDGRKRYDYIVLQEYSTFVALSPDDAMRTLLHTYEPTFARALKPGGRVVLFKNWALVDPDPFASRAAAKTAIDTGYAALSSALRTPNLLAPIGDEFETIAAERGPSYLIVPDGKHPNDRAIYLDAVTLFGILFHDSPRDLTDLYVDPADAAYLRSVAAAAIGY